MNAFRYFGGITTDSINSIAFLPGGDLIIAGGTGSSDIPGAPDRAPNFLWDGFIAILSSDLSTMRYFSFVGEDQPASVSEIAVAGNRVYLIGSTFATRLGDLTLACDGNPSCAYLAAFDLGP